MARKPSDFRDIRHPHGFFRVAAITPRVTLAQPSECAVDLSAAITKAYQKGAQLIVAPELFLSGGYTMQDLHFDRAIREETDDAIAWLLTDTENINAVIAFGCSVEIGSLLFNGMYVLYKGKILGIVIKTAPPNYGEFTEGRYFRPASELPFKTITKFGQEIPVGNDLLFCHTDQPDVILGGEICEDSWLAITPGTRHALNGATVVFSGHGSNYQVGKAEWRRHLARRIGDNIAAYIYATAGAGESSTGLVFDNQNLISDRGTIIAEADVFQNDVVITIADISLNNIVSDRMRTNSWSSSASQFSTAFPDRRISFGGHGILGTSNTSVYHKFEREFDPEPFVPKTDAEKALLFRARVIGLKRRLEHLPPAMRKLVLGLSGGKDSASVLMVAIAVVDEFGEKLGMTRQDIHCITMPGFGTSKGTKNFALELARATQVSFYERPIGELAQVLFESVGQPLLSEMIKVLPPNSPQTLLFENTQVFARKITELVMCQAIGAIDLGSTSASEALIGWFTLFGDGSAHYAPNAGMSKSAVKAELLWLAETEHQLVPDLPEILKAIARSDSSPELLELSKTGEILQKSEEINGPDSVRDFYAYHLLRHNQSPRTIYRMAIEAYADLHSRKDLYTWLERFLKRLAENWYKLNMQSIDSVKVGAVSPSSHDNTKLPSDFKPVVWLRDLATVPIEYRS